MKITKNVVLENGTKVYSAQEITEAIADPGIRVTGFFIHSKASEKYIIATYSEDGRAVEWMIPYQYRRTGTFIYY